MNCFVYCICTIILLLQLFPSSFKGLLLLEGFVGSKKNLFGPIKEEGGFKKFELSNSYFKTVNSLLR